VACEELILKMPKVQEVSSSEGFAGTAFTGTAWATGQTVLNKLFMLAAIWVISRQLTQDEFGSAALAITVVKFLSILPPLNMADVLMVIGSRWPEAGQFALRFAFKVGIGATLFLVIAAPLVFMFYSKHQTAVFAGVFLVASLRPLGEALQVGNLTTLRMAFKNRTIALIDGGVQLVATLASVVMALIGCGAWAVVVPPVSAVFGRAFFYKEACRRALPTPPKSLDSGGATSQEVTPLDVRRQFVAASGGQYLHSVADSLPILILGKLASDTETGIYAFALSLSGQANALVATQIAGVLQPVLGRLAHDPRRQTDGYLRTMRLVSAIAIPVCVVQAVFSEMVFMSVFEEKWQAAGHVFAALSICEAFFFASAPTMAMLKAQGRFRTFLIWQSVQLVGSVLVLPIAALNGGALSVAVCVTCLWAVGLPIAVWVSVRNSGHTIWEAFRLFVIPWLTAIPIGLAGWYIGQQMLVFGRSGAILATLVAAPITLIVMLAVTRWTQPSVFHEIIQLARMGLKRLPMFRGTLSV
jgi:PST family polysaccharide transporter